ncbi:hypothetical protein TNCV_1095461 [Trichonephila clavipes]|nr:hypothetical protein TNCV_1095461 [Trichonephila clavipes]
MDDNATCHRTLAVQDCLDSEGIQRLVWPARSPDLNPIENVWDALGRQVAGRNYPLTNKITLIRALTEEWEKLPQQLLDNVVQSMIPNIMELHRRRGQKDSLATSLADPHIFKTNSSTGIHTPVNGYNKWFPEDDPYLPHLEKMVSLTYFCELWFLPESESKVAAIVGDHRYHTPRH